MFKELKEAEGINAKLTAEAKGLSNLVASANGNINGLVQCLIVQKDMLPRLIEEQSKGIQGLNPKINIWNTSSTGKASSAIEDFFKTTIPLFEQIKDQTGKDLLSSIGIKKAIEEYNNGEPQKNEYNQGLPHNNS